MSFFRRTKIRLLKHLDLIEKNFRSGAFAKGLSTTARINHKHYMDYRDSSKNIGSLFDIVQEERGIVQKEQATLKELNSHLKLLEQSLLKIYENGAVQNEDELHDIEDEVHKTISHLEVCHSTFKKLKKDHKLLSRDEDELENYKG